MEKDFDGWNARKKRMEVAEQKKFFHEREVWWCSLGVNVGFEQDGKNDLYERPVLVIQKFNRDILWAIPLTSTKKKGAYYFPISANKRESVAILSQLRLISSKRLQRRMYKLPNHTFQQLREQIQDLFLKAYR